MDVRQFSIKIKGFLSKYKYAAIVLLIGLLLLNLPIKKSENAIQEQIELVTQSIDEEALTKVLQLVDGAGKVKVLLSIANGEETIYQTDSDTVTGENSTSKTETVILSGSDRSETGLIRQVNPPTYLGAIVVCEGADSASVRLAIMQAVSKITGLGADSICVLKMK